MKRILSGLCALLMAAAIFAPSLSAAGEIRYDITSTTKAPTLDGKVTQAEYANNAPIVFDGSGKNTESGWDANTSWTGQTIKLYYTWDKSNLYVGITVEGETTADQTINFTKDTDCIWGKGDMIQLGFNPGLIIRDVQPLYYCIGFDENKQPSVHGDAYQSTTDGTQSKYVESEIKGFSKKYSASGLNYECEVAIPWNKIFVKGVCRANQGAKLFDMTGEAAKLKDGYELPVFMLYHENKTGKTVRSAGKAFDYTWNAQDMCPIRLVLKEAKAAAPAAASSAAKTADGVSIAAAALVLSAAVLVVSKKKH